MGLGDISNDTVGLIGVCRDDDFVSEKVSHHSDIVNTLMSISIFANIKTVMGTDELEVCFVDIVETMLIIGLINAEDSKIRKEGEKSRLEDWLCPDRPIHFQRLFGYPASDLFRNFLGCRSGWMESP